MKLKPMLGYKKRNPEYRFGWKMFEIKDRLDASLSRKVAEETQ